MEGIHYTSFKIWSSILMIIVCSWTPSRTIAQTGNTDAQAPLSGVSKEVFRAILSKQEIAASTFASRIQTKSFLMFVGSTDPYWHHVTKDYVEMVANLFSGNQKL